MSIIICEIDCQIRFNVWNRVLRDGALGVTLREWDGERVGGRVRDREHMYTHEAD